MVGKLRRILLRKPTVGPVRDLVKVGLPKKLEERVKTYTFQK